VGRDADATALGVAEKGHETTLEAGMQVRVGLLEQQTASSTTGRG
jgi:hypothetical protein